jgi:hypothetical protein
LFYLLLLEPLFSDEELLIINNEKPPPPPPPPPTTITTTTKLDIHDEKYNKDDIFHGISYSNKHEKDLNKKNFYENQGYNVNIKWESEWIKDKEIMKQNNTNWY